MVGNQFSQDATASRNVLYGGYFRTSLGVDNWYGSWWWWDGSTWTSKDTNNDQPGGLFGAGMARTTYLGTSGVMMFGGGRNGTTVLDDTWFYASSSNTWTHLSPAHKPSARHSFAIGREPVSGKDVIFSGLNVSSQIVTGTWQFTGS
jgi:hypothetical protein